MPQQDLRARDLCGTTGGCRNPRSSDAATREATTLPGAEPWWGGRSAHGSTDRDAGQRRYTTAHGCLGRIGQEVHTPRILAVDDWAWRRGHRYGSILVGLERNQVIDLLPDRQAETWPSGSSSIPRRGGCSRSRRSLSTTDMNITKSSPLYARQLEMWAGCPGIQQAGKPLVSVAMRRMTSRSAPSGSMSALCSQPVERSRRPAASRLLGQSSFPEKH